MTASQQRTQGHVKSVVLNVLILRRLILVF